jgi:hypothetical protein
MTILGVPQTPSYACQALIGSADHEGGRDHIAAIATQVVPTGTPE